MKIRFRLAAFSLLSLLLLAGCAVLRPAGTPAVPSATPTRTRPAASATARVSATPAPTATEFVRRLGISGDALQGQTVQLWHPWVGAEGEAFQVLVDEFNRDNRWGVRVSAVAQTGYDGLQTELTGALDEGQPPDVAIGYIYQALGWHAQRPLGDWQPYLSDPDWGWSADEQADFYPVFLEGEQVDGRQVGLPVLRSAQVLYYNQSWADELQFFRPPDTPQRFADQACAATKAMRSDATVENDGLSGWAAAPHYSATLSWITSFGGQVLTGTQSTKAPSGTTVPPGTIVPQSNFQFNQPATQAAFTFIRELYDDSCVMLIEGRDPAEIFARRQALLSSGSVMGIAYQTHMLSEARNSDAWTVIAYPSPDDTPALSVYGPSLYLIAAEPERQLAAWVFVQWLLAAENHITLVEASGSYPLRQAELPLLERYLRRYPAYAAALELLPQAQAEPPLLVWEQARWALSDASTQLLRPYFQLEQLPNMLKLLDETIRQMSGN